jgi:tripartite ATP-independent transporter DctP family solute receptor
MLKRMLSGVLCAAVAAAVLTGCNKNQSISPNSSGTVDKSKLAEKTIVFRLAENQPEDYPTTLGDKEFARLVSDRTNGRIKIEVYAGGQLGNEESVAEQIQFGALDFARLSISPLSQFENSLGVLMLPYLYRDRDHMFKVLDGSIGDNMLSKLTKSGIIGLSWYDAGARSFYNTKKEVKTPDDMKGLKIRVQDTALMMDFVTALGASPVAMAYGDVYSALQTGAIDGAENNWPSFEATKHYEAAKFFTIDEHTRVPELLLSSKLSIDKLSPEDQDIVKNAAKEAAIFERAEWVKREEVSKKKIESSGVKITTLVSNSAFQEKVKNLYDKHEKDYKDVIHEILNTK